MREPKSKKYYISFKNDVKFIPPVKLQSHVLLWLQSSLTEKYVSYFLLPNKYYFIKAKAS